MKKLYEDRVLGRITEDRYNSLSAAYEEEHAKLKSKIQELRESINSVSEDNANLERFIKTMRDYMNFKELTPEILYLFIDRIEIGAKEKKHSQKVQEIKIVYNFVGAIALPQNE